MGSLLSRPVGAESDLPAEVHVSQAAECLIGLQLVAMPRARCAQLEIGCSWFDRVRTLAPTHVLDELDAFQRFKHAATVWFLLAGLTVDGPATVPELVLVLEDMPALELWSQMLGLRSRHEVDLTLQQAVLSAGEGEVERLEREARRLDRWSRQWVPEVVTLFERNAEVAKQRVVTVLRLWYAHVFRNLWPELEPKLVADARVKQRLGRQLSSRQLVDRATNGLEYVFEVGVDRLVLVPSHLLRPWSAQLRQRRTLMICYPAEDDASRASADAQAARVLAYAGVLADGTRIRALRRLARSSVSLQQLADDVGVSKSTMHHHLAALRSVGLLRFRPDEKRYSLRREALSELATLLDTTFRA